MNDWTNKVWMTEALASDLGTNAKILADVCALARPGQLLVDCGVRHGVSSRVMLGVSDDDCLVLGIDVFPGANLQRDLATHERYTYLQSDSVEAGMGRGGGSGCAVVMLDTLHSADHVWLECLAWWRHVAVGGYLVIHDTEWPEGKQEIIGGLLHSNGRNGVVKFFGVIGNADTQHFEMRHYPTSWGMTFIRKLKDGFIGDRSALVGAHW